MTATSRELVYQTLAFENPFRTPRQLWYLPWAEIYYPGELAAILAEFPPDILTSPDYLKLPRKAVGNPTEPGAYIDDWGCTFINLQRGVIGEVKEPLIQDWTADASKVRIPREWLSVDIDAVNRWCDVSDAFIIAGCCPRPFEQLQFIRGTAELYMDLLFEPAPLFAFIREMHRFYCELLTLWAETRVDALMIMDDWGSQSSLLIDPQLWRRIFKPLYRDYIQIAHNAGKKLFMHSDGYILDIYPDLIELGVDALNSQIFCMGLDKLAPYAGKITFWGELDRQHLLVEGAPREVEDAVRAMKGSLWRRGGCIAQCEFGAGARPENVRAGLAAWYAETGV